MNQEPLSLEEAEALRVLQGYGNPLAAALIGIARRHFVSEGMAPTVSQIIDYAHEAHAAIDGPAKTALFDHTLAEARDCALAHIKNNLPEIQMAELALANALRELLMLQRVEFARSGGANLTSCGKVRMTLYPDKIPAPDSDPSFIGQVTLGEQKLLLRAWVGKKEPFINLEISFM